MKTMYPGIAFSPLAALAEPISAEDTVITVNNPDAFPDGPNIACIGTDEQGETIIYAAKAGKTLSGCTRGVEGSAKAWEAGEAIGRNWSNYDYEALRINLAELGQEAEKKANKVRSAKAGNLAALDGEGDLQDSGLAASRVPMRDEETGFLPADSFPPGIGLPENAALWGTGGVSQEGDPLPLDADTLGGKSPEEFAQVEDGKLSPMPSIADIGGSNPNLLDNPDFSINQRGKDEYTAIGYTVDRFYLGIIGSGNTGSYTASTKTLKCAKVDTDGYYTYLHQVVEIPSRFAGKKLTLTTLAKKATQPWMIQCWRSKGSDVTAIASAAYNLSLFKSLTFTVPEDITDQERLRMIVAQTRGELEIVATKLELGEEQTLAHQDSAGDWVLNDPPPNLQQELAKCQRHYRRWASDSNGPLLFTGVMNATNRAYLSVELGVPMRCVPAVKYDQVTIYSGTGETSSPSPLNLHFAAKDGNGNIVQVTLRADGIGLEAGRVVQLLIHSGGYLEFDANI